MKTAVIVPALNEAGNIAALVHETRAQSVDWVIVVDNGSTDETAARAQNAGAVVVSEPRRGYGFACAAGTAVAMAKGADILAYIDGDFSSLPSELPLLLVPIQKNEADLVLGSRALGHIAVGAMLPHQRFGNWLSARIMSWLYQITVTDLGPYRAIRADLLQSLHMREMTFGWPTEMMVKTAKRNGRILEVPVSWHVRRSGQSKVSGTLRGSFLAAYYILGVTFRYAWRG
ncbi:MAG: glycosyltransferase family 2 protein [Anaerolineales bacterium]|nr:glycosyltransferase family 2 protein [Anaerolineales bacterium]MCA9929438.1 glycosyltransferase family 2 protein [Anaerolineales bacterium]